jgi:hypothetical protein
VNGMAITVPDQHRRPDSLVLYIQRSGAHSRN